MRPDEHLPPDAALFSIDPGTSDVVTATEYSRGPWDPRACHGGPIGALLARAVELMPGEGDRREATAWQTARLTIELVRPVPVLVPMRVGVTVERQGRSVALIGADLHVVDGPEVARARVLRIRSARIALAESYVVEPSFGEPGAGTYAPPTWALEHTAFHRDAVELRFTQGSFDDRGPVSMWCRLRVPVVVGETPSGVQRAVAASDFGNGVSSELDPELMSYLNPDLTVHLARPPQGIWIGSQARSHYGPEGAGFADAALYDEAGRLGRAVQSLLVAPRA